jgi:hypothetical protein
MESQKVEQTAAYSDEYSAAMKDAEMVALTVAEWVELMEYWTVDYLVAM